MRNRPRHRVAAVAMAAGLLLTSACAASDDGDHGNGDWLGGTVNIGGKYDQPGFDLHAAHSNTGFEADLANYLGEKLGFTPSIQDVESARREEVLKSGYSKLVIATYSITETRRDDVDFAGPYLVTQQGFLVRKGDERIRTRSDVDGDLDICTVAGSTSADDVLPKDVRPYLVDDYRTCVDDLEHKRVDAVFTDLAILYGYTKAEKDLRVVKDVTFGAPNRYGIGLPKGHTAECRKIVRALRGFLRDEWAERLTTQLRTLVDAYPDDFENRFKPRVTDLDTYSSCGAS